MSSPDDRSELDPSAKDARLPIPWEPEGAALAPADGAPRHPAEGARTAWLKALLPFAVLAVYAATATLRDAGGPPRVDRDPGSLTGVSAENNLPRLTRAQRDALAKLEPLAAQGRWRDVRDTLLEVPGADLAHPALDAFEALALHHLGIRTERQKQRLADASSRLAGARDFRPLRERIDLAQVATLVEDAKDGVALTAASERVRRLLEGMPNQSDVIATRLLVAERFEREGDVALARDSSVMGYEPASAREARAWYQSGLRFVIPPERWIEATPYSPTLAPAAERILGKLRRANRAVNSLMDGVPFTGRDRDSWTGEAGAPLHDAPPPSR
ncbi:MAG: hypothetical protein SF028_09045 [Candidatus Sumerlaeia bacterium]|nr:hypothetical protein [Candidatus Sumerlaeia bacterium]